MSVAIDSKDVQEDRYIDAVGAEITRAANHAFTYIDGEPTIDTAPPRIARKTAVFDANFVFKFETETKFYRGGVDNTNGIDVVNRSSFQTVANARRTQWTREYATDGYMRERIKHGKVYDETLREGCIAICHDTCGSCAGHGSHTCAGCSGRKTIQCNRCSMGGKERCPCNGQAGNACTQCFGKYEITCRYCYGNTYVGCTSCGQRGSISCDSCNGNGSNSTGLVARYRLVTGLKTRETSFTPDEHARITEWVEKGMPGRATNDGARFTSVSTLDTQTATEAGNSTGDVRGFAMPFRVSASLTTFDFEHGGEKQSARAMLLDRPWVRFTPFLDGDLAAMNERLLGRFGGTPSAFLDAVKNPGLVAALREGWGEEAISLTFPAYVEQDTNGAISAGATGGVAVLYISSISRFAKASVRKAMKATAVIMAAAWAILLAVGFARYLHNLFNPLVLGGSVLLPATLTVALVKGIARSAVTTESGHSKAVEVGWATWGLALAVGLAYGFSVLVMR